MSAALRRSAFALIIGLALFGLILVSSGRASAQEVASGTVTVNPLYPNYFECTATGSFIQGGDEPWGQWNWQIILDGKAVDAYVSPADIVPGTLVATQIGPLYIGSGGVDGGLLHGQHTCEFKAVDIDYFSGGPPGYQIVTLWDSTLPYDFP